MSEVLKIYDGGIQKIKGGHVVGLVIFDVVTGEGKPETLVGYCRPNHRDAVIKSLKRMIWKLPAEHQPGDSRAAPPQPDSGENQ